MGTLALDYRPRTFNEVRGNETTIKAIKSVMAREKENIPHTMLFCGPSGCGKTTLARIVANDLGCIGGDFTELDIADFRGIETAREIRRNMNYRPMEGDCRVYLLDEVHRLTGDAQEALLKAFEDTPDHVYFLLATTDPKKLKVTVRNRCTAFEVSPLSSREMQRMLEEVLKEERVDVPREALDAIVDNCMGSPRSALQLLEKIIDMDPADMEEAVEKAAQDLSQVIDLCRALIKKEKWANVAKTLKGLEDQDPESVRHQVLGYCSAILVKEDNSQAFLVADSFRRPFYESGGKSGLILACYEALNA